ncbi:MAG: hypothetical protein NC097_00760 [Clostridium sp.]|nr:hypothetical protein [Prevotella sp.]MCM1428311.1 hypothetical protein [Clostridium sp.]MCM1474783.1 hypothetical protein [Muribaculaceae bacterium]
MIFAALICAVGFQCCQSNGKGDSGEDTIRQVVSADSLSVLEHEADNWADSVMRTMSLQLRVGQLFMPAVFTSNDQATMALISDYADRLGVGGIVLLKGNVKNAALIADSLSAFAPCPMFVAVDAETGLSMRFADAPDFLWNSQIKSEADTADLYDYGRELARECRLMGINMVLGPVLDVIPQKLPQQGRRVDFLRSFGSDPGRVAMLGVAYSRGIEDGGLISVAKHFPGHGSASADSHKNLAIVDRSLEEVRSVDLFPFRRYVDEGLSAIMVGHIYMKAIDTVSRPAAFSPIVMTDLLRVEMKFRGLILTDAINMHGADGYSSVEAIGAGADIVMAPRNTERAIAEVCDAVERGELRKEIVNDHCHRILKYKFLKGIAGQNRHRSGNASLQRDLHKEAPALRHRLKPAR